MKPFDIHSHLKYPKSILQFIGMWPKKSPSFRYNLLGLLSFCLTSSFGVLSSMKGGYDVINGNIETGAFSLCSGLASIHAAYKIGLLHYKKEEFFKLLENLQDPEVILHEDCLDVYLRSRLDLSTKVFTFEFVSCLSASAMIVIGDLILNYNSMPKSLPNIYFDEKHLVLRICIWIYFTLATLASGYVIGSYEGLMFNFLSFPVIQLKMLQKQITKAIDSYPAKELNPKETEENDLIVNQLLRTCVKRHNAIERYVQSVEVKFSNSYLVQFIITLFVTAIMGLTIIFTSAGSLNFTRCIIFFIADLAQVITLCIPCNEIIVESEKIRDACYMSSWRICGPSVCKTLFIIMERTKRPMYVTSGKFTIISLETFLSFLKMTMSYFTVLKSLYWDSNK